MVAAVALAAAMLALTAGAAFGASPSGFFPQRVRTVSAANAPAPAAGIQPLGALTEFPGWGPCDPSGFCWGPGEPVVAVGPNDVLETVNTVATVYSKSGTQLAQFDFSDFFGPKEISCGDPRALYIASIERFAFSCTGFSVGPMRFAISKTSNPAGAWFTYAAPNTESLDQDKIAASSNKFVIAGNGSSEENAEWIYVYNLSELAAGVKKPAAWKLLAKKSNLYMPAVEQTATSNVYLVASYPGNPLYLATITGTPAEKNVALTQTEIKSTDFAAPSEPAVPGGRIGGGDLDGRIYDAVYETETSDDKPVIVYSSARECGTRTCISVGKIDLSGTKPVLSSYVLMGEPGWDYTYGAVGLNGEGSMFVVYSRSNATTAPGVGVLGPGFDVTLKPAGAGATSCASGESEPCNERWGDYLGTAIDPSEPSSIWVSGLYQNQSGGFGWGSEIAKISTSTFALPTATTTGAWGETATSAKVSGTVNPQGVATTYHIDYGLTSGYEAATSEKSAGSGTSPISVSATLTGLKPGTTYHYRVVATTSTGNAIGVDKTFKTEAPSITAVQFAGTPTEPTVTITGSSFGPKPGPEPSEPLTCFAGDTSFDYGTSLYFTDTTQGWTAGEIGDCIGLIVSTYTETQIVYRFGAGYSHYGLLTSGDAYTLVVGSTKHGGTVAYG
ncbi:MAG TPA: fibronectin type III domain-containing protein [Solirubrobacteraceae bacterium]|jgi:hypothetical protein|nr:fibronectin type III domain-containing protein [Solirubrobacteraceae bacterium]